MRLFASSNLGDTWNRRVISERSNRHPLCEDCALWGPLARSKYTTVVIPNDTLNARYPQISPCSNQFTGICWTYREALALSAKDYCDPQASRSNASHSVIAGQASIMDPGLGSETRGLSSERASSVSMCMLVSKSSSPGNEWKGISDDVSRRKQKAGEEKVSVAERRFTSEVVNVQRPVGTRGEGGLRRFDEQARRGRAIVVIYDANGFPRWGGSTFSPKGGLCKRQEHCGGANVLSFTSGSCGKVRLWSQRKGTGRTIKRPLRAIEGTRCNRDVPWIVSPGLNRLTELLAGNCGWQLIPWPRCLFNLSSSDRRFPLKYCVIATVSPSN